MDDASIDLLLMPSSPDHSSFLQQPNDDDEEEEPRLVPVPSPATQTLNGFSQPDLRISQLDLDAASALMQARCEDPSALLSDTDEGVNSGNYHKKKKAAIVVTASTSTARNRKVHQDDSTCSSSSSSSEEEDPPPPQVVTNVKKRKGPNQERRIILQLDATTGECLGRFDSFRAIAKSIGVHYMTVRSILEGERESTRGWRFCYEGDESPHKKRRSSLLGNPKTTLLSPKSNLFAIGASTQKSVGGFPSTCVKQRSSHKRKKGKATSTRAHMVEQIDVSTGQVVRVHRSLTIAEQAIGIQRQIISRIVKGELASFQGWTFRRVDGPMTGVTPLGTTRTTTRAAIPTLVETNAMHHPSQPQNNNDNNTESGETIPSNATTSNIKVIEQIDVVTGQVVATHPSFTAAGKAMNCRRQLISSIVNGDNDTYEIEGYTFRCRSIPNPQRLNNKDTPTIGRAKSPTTGSQGEKSVQVIRIATGECVGTYPTFTAVGNALGCDRRVISKMANGQTAEFGGFTVRVQHVHGTTASDHKKTTVVEKISTVSQHRSAVDPTLKFRSLAGIKSKPPKQVSPPNYGFIPIAIDESGALGINVKHAPVSKELQTAIHVYTGQPISIHETGKSMQVTSFKKESSLAKRHGVKAGDWFFLAGEDEHTMEIDYDQVATAIKAAHRPLALIIARDANLHGRTTVSPNENRDPSNTNGGGNGQNHHRPPSQSDRNSSNAALAKPSTSPSHRGTFHQGHQPTMRRLDFIEKPVLQPLKPLAVKTRRSNSRIATTTPSPTLVRPSVKHFRLSDKGKSPSETCVTSKTTIASQTSAWSMTNSRVSKGSKPDQSQQHVEKYGISQTSMPGKSVRNTQRHHVDEPAIKDTSQRKTSHKAKPSVDSSPFCLVCNGLGKASAFHHAWCPKHPGFDKSGAAEIYDRIVSGRVVGCSVCEKEFQSGRRCSEPHTDACKKIESKKVKQMKKAMASDPTDSDAKVDPNLEDMGTEAVLEDEDELSVYQAQSNQPGRKYNKLSLVDDSQSQTKIPPPKDTTKNFFMTKDNKAKRVEKQKTSKQSSCPNPFVESEKTCEKPDEAINQQYDPTPSNDNVVKPTTDSKVKAIVWNNSVNPWGPTEHLLDDCIILSPSWNGSHHDYLIPTPRYSFHPFASDDYKETHRDPLDYGFHVVTLERDAFGTLPWGFQVKRHDFGGACIISNVDPLSPASSATIVGSGGRLVAPLARNDIVMSIEGTYVGGLSELTVQLLLEVSGSNLTVTVARYLHAETIQKEASMHESILLKLNDQHCADKRLMDWINAGIVVPDFSSFPIKSGEPNTRKKKIYNKVTHEELSLEKTIERSIEAQTGRMVTVALVHQEGRLSKASLVQATELPTDLMIASKHTETLPTPERDCPIVTTPLSCRNQSSPTVPPSIDASPMDNTENPWFNCVCMKAHDETVPLFWIQCGICCSWYNVARGCIGFGEEQAESIDWVCPGCPEDGCDNFSDGQNQTPTTMMKSFLPAISSHEGVSQVHSTTDSCTLTLNHNTSEDDSPCKGILANEKQETDTKTVPIFQVGDRVNVQQHSWAHVNHPEGLAVILKAYKDENGDQLYDIKYVIERIRKRGVMARFLSPHSLPALS